MCSNNGNIVLLIKKKFCTPYIPFCISLDKFIGPKNPIIFTLKKINVFALGIHWDKTVVGSRRQEWTSSILNGGSFFLSKLAILNLVYLKIIVKPSGTFEIHWIHKWNWGCIHTIQSVYFPLITWWNRYSQ